MLNAQIYSPLSFKNGEAINVPGVVPLAKLFSVECSLFELYPFILKEQPFLQWAGVGEFFFFQM